MPTASETLDWLLDADPAIRWQVLRDLTDASDGDVAAERARVARDGMGAALLDLQAEDGQWGGGTYYPKWISTHYSLMTLRDFGPDPADDRVRKAIDLVRDNVRSEWFENESGIHPLFFEGEDEACVNGMVLAVGASFGVSMEGLVDRMLDTQLPDGGWNCDVPESKVTSVDSTVCVLEGLLDYETSVGGNPTTKEAREKAHQYLLERKLFRSKRTGQIINDDWLLFSFPTRWPYDILRGLDYFRATGAEPDDRLAEAIQVVLDARQPDGRWILHDPYLKYEPPYHVGYHFEYDQGIGEPSRWITLKALRVLDWAGAS